MAAARKAYPDIEANYSESEAYSKILGGSKESFKHQWSFYFLPIKIANILKIVNKKMT